MKTKWHIATRWLNLKRWHEEKPEASGLNALESGQFTSRADPTRCDYDKSLFPCASEGVGPLCARAIAVCLVLFSVRPLCAIFEGIALGAASCDRLFLTLVGLECSQQAQVRSREKGGAFYFTYDFSLRRAWRRNYLEMRIIDAVVNDPEQLADTWL